MDSVSSPQDARTPEANGVIEQMEQEDTQERNDGGVRIETAGLVNGDMGDRSTERSDQSPTRTERTGTDGHGDEDRGTNTESEHRNEEVITETKVRARLLLHPHIAPQRLVCVFVSSLSGRYKMSALIYAKHTELIQLRVSLTLSG